MRARGTVEIDRQHGEQLRVASVTELAPTTLAGIGRYLRVGAHQKHRRADRVADRRKFGLETLKVLDEQPHRLAGVKGSGGRGRGRSSKLGRSSEPSAT